jgi:3-dehydroquinate synthetase
MSTDLVVELGDKSYPIHFPADVMEAVRGQLDAYTQIGRQSVLLTDDGVARAQSQFLAQAFGSVPRLIVPAGERTKSLETFGKVLDFLAANRLNRQAILWVVGGGVVGDLGGFAAASYLRGISYVQVPTTLLAMVDSSVGGKTGINLTAGKNLVGAFHHPQAVFIGREFLQSLPPREFAAGMAEVIKYGLLGADDIARVEKTVAAHNLPIRLRGPLPLAELQNATTRDKKNRADGVRFVVMHALGRAATRSGIAPPTVEAVWREIGAV